MIPIADKINFQLIFAWLFALFFILSSTQLFALDGASLAKRYCKDCHQQDGNSKNSKIPRIAGFSSLTIIDSLDQFKHGYRSAIKITIKKKTLNMIEISKHLQDAELEAVAEYYAKQTFKSAPQTNKSTITIKQIAEGKQLHEDLCNDCHGDYGKSTADDAPILAGQWKTYLVRQFKLLSTFKRDMPNKMERKFNKLTEQDKIALIAFYTQSH